VNLDIKAECLAALRELLPEIRAAIADTVADDKDLAEDKWRCKPRNRQLMVVLEEGPVALQRDPRSRAGDRGPHVKIRNLQSPLATLLSR
jgi:hypothetical protein